VGMGWREGLGSAVIQFRIGRLVMTQEMMVVDGVPGVEIVGGLDLMWRYRVDICVGTGEVRLLRNMEVVPLIGWADGGVIRITWEGLDDVPVLENLEIW
jgi:hypothetical protein